MKCKICDHEFFPGGDGKLEHFIRDHLGLMWEFQCTRKLAETIDTFLIEDLQK